MASNVDKKIKLIWDFRGPAAAKTAEHHEKHLAEFVLNEDLALDSTGFENFSDFHSIAFMVVNESEMKRVRDLLKPHRGEIYEQ